MSKLPPQNLSCQNLTEYLGKRFHRKIPKKELRSDFEEGAVHVKINVTPDINITVQIITTNAREVAFV